MSTTVVFTGAQVGVVSGINMTDREKYVYDNLHPDVRAAFDKQQPDRKRRLLKAWRQRYLKDHPDSKTAEHWAGVRRSRAEDKRARKAMLRQMEALLTEALEEVPS